MESRLLAAALDDAGWTAPLDVVSWSPGGAIALAFALDHPARVRSLALVEPDVFWALSDAVRTGPEIAPVEARWWRSTASSTSSAPSTTP